MFEQAIPVTTIPPPNASRKIDTESTVKLAGTDFTVVKYRIISRDSIIKQRKASEESVIQVFGSKDRYYKHIEYEIQTLKPNFIANPQPYTDEDLRLFDNIKYGRYEGLLTIQGVKFWVPLKVNEYLALEKAGLIKRSMNQADSVQARIYKYETILLGHTSYTLPLAKSLNIDIEKNNNNPTNVSDLKVTGYTQFLTGLGVDWLGYDNAVIYSGYHHFLTNTPDASVKATEYLNNLQQIIITNKVNAIYVTLPTWPKMTNIQNTNLSTYNDAIRSIQPNANELTKIQLTAISNDLNIFIRDNNHDSISKISLVKIKKYLLGNLNTHVIDFAKQSSEMPYSLNTSQYPNDAGLTWLRNEISNKLQSWLDIKIELIKLLILTYNKLSELQTANAKLTTANMVTKLNEYVQKLTVILDAYTTGNIDTGQIDTVQNDGITQGELNDILFKTSSYDPDKKLNIEIRRLANDAMLRKADNFTITDPKTKQIRTIRIRSNKKDPTKAELYI